MKEYEFDLVTTKGGDRGESSLYSQEREVKNSPIFEAVGELDELNSYFGIIRASLEGSTIKTGLFKSFNLPSEIRGIQKDIMAISSLIATNPMSELYNKLKQIDEAVINKIEKREIALLKQTKISEEFIIPGDTGLASAQIDFARALTRRCERRIVALIRERGRIDLIECQKYLNRLSDLLFILARFVEQS